MTGSALLRAGFFFKSFESHFQHRRSENTGWFFFQHFNDLPEITLFIHSSIVFFLYWSRQRRTSGLLLSVTRKLPISWSIRSNFSSPTLFLYSTKNLRGSGALPASMTIFLVSSLNLLTNLSKHLQ